MAAKILSVVISAANAAALKAAFDIWAAAGYVVCSVVMKSDTDLIVFYYA